MVIPTILLVTVTLLTVDSVIEIGFISATVAYLAHAHNGVPFEISATGSTPQFGLYPRPAHLLVNQGHTSNGAAGTALVLVCVPVFVWSWVDRRRRARSHRALDHFQDANALSRKTPPWTLHNLLNNWRWLLHLTWVIITVLSFLLTLAAFVFTFIVTQQSQINLNTAAAVSKTKISNPYPDGHWTPENWYEAVLALDFVDSSQKANITLQVNVMAGWRWNLIPLLFLGFVTTALAVRGYIKTERASADSGGKNSPEKLILPASA